MRKKRRFNTLAIILAAMLAFSGVGTAFAEPVGSTAIEEIVSIEDDSAEIVEEEAAGEISENVEEEAAAEEDVAEVTEEDAAEVTVADAAEVTEEDAAESVEEDAAEVTEEDSAEAVEEDAAEVTEEDAAEVTENDAPEVTEDDGSGAAEIESKEAVEEEPAGGVEEEPAEVVVKETPEAAEEETSEAAAEESTEAAEEETPEAVEEETTEAAAKESTEAAAEETPETVEKEATEAVAEETPEAMKEESSVITQMTRLEAPTISLTANYNPYYGFILLEWNKVNNANKYVIYKNGSILKEVGSSDHNYSDYDNEIGDTFYYYVSAYDSTGNLICKSSTVSETVSVQITIGEPVVSNYYVAVEYGKVIGVSKCQLWRNGINLNLEPYWVDELSNVFMDFTLTYSGTYIYEVVGFDENGNEVCKSNPRTVTWTAPEGGIVPMKITDVGNTTKGVSIYWQPDSRAKYHNLFRSHKLSDGTTETPRETLEDNEKSPTLAPLDGLISGELYEYEGIASAFCFYNYMWEESVYEEVSSDSFVKRYIGTTTMMAPTCTAKGLRVSWPKVKGAKKYVIFRSVGAGTPDWKYLTTVTATSDAIQVYNSNGAFTPGTWYAFTVRAIGEDNPFNPNDTCYGGQPAGRSVLYRQPVKVTKLQSIQSGVRATFTSVTAGYTYGLYRAKVTGSTVGSYSLVSTVTNSSVGRDVWITDKTAENGTQYSYYVRCLSSDKKTPLSSYANTMTITYKKP